MPRRAAVPLLVALLCALAAALVGVLALSVPGAHVRDAAILHGFVDLYGPDERNLVLKVLANLGDPLPYLVMGAALFAIAMVRGRRARAVAVLILLVAPGATTQALKQLLAEPRVLDWLGNDSPSATAWPSGHATAAMTLALCGVLVAPRRLRSVAVVLGAALAIGVGFALLALHWHYPSDVLGGYLVAGAWAAMAKAALTAVEPVEAPPPVDRTVGAVLVAGPVAAALTVALARQDGVAAYASESATLMVGALVLAAAAVLIPAALSRA